MEETERRKDYDDGKGTASHLVIYSDLFLADLAIAKVPCQTKRVWGGAPADSQEQSHVGESLLRRL